MLESESVTGAATEEKIPQSEEQEPKTEEVTVEGENEEVSEVETFQDPGQLEGMGVEGKQEEHEPPPGHPRFKEVYGKYKENERLADDLTKKLEETERKLAEAEAKSISQVPQVPQQPPVDNLQEPKQTAQDEEIKGLKDQLNDLKTERKKANIDMDGEKVSELQDKIDDINYQIMSKEFSSKHAINQKDITSAMREEEVKIEASKFSARNPWLAITNADNTPNPNYDYAKSAAAIQLEKNLLPTWKGSYADLLVQVENKINERFNPKGAQPKPAAPAVRGVTGASKPNQSNVITLTDAQKKAARGIFPESNNPERDYINLVKSQEKGVA